MEAMDATDTDVTPAREELLKLMKQRDEIEKNLREMKQILDTNGVGMHDALIDPEGFPRHDIDVYQVRHARHNIICLQNDHKAIMKEIEKGLHTLHSQTSGSMPEDDRFSYNKHEEDRPIARVNYVHNDSPAILAGLMVDDVILSFGTVNYDNFKSLQDIGNVVQHSIGKSIPLLVKRGESTKRILLTPKEWSGKGLLGCNILPVKNFNE